MTAEEARETRPEPRPYWQRFIANRASTLLALLALVTAFAYLARLHFLLELLTHFRVFYAGAALGLMCLFLALRSWRWAGLSLLVAALNLPMIVPAYLPRHAPEAPANLRILCANVFTINTDHAKAVDLIRRVKPDVIVLDEVDSNWVRALTAIENDYPHAVKQPRRDNFGIAVYSRLPLAEPRILELGESQVPAIAARLAVSGTPVTLLALHTLPPGSTAMAADRNAQLKSAAEFARNSKTPIVVCGDLNVTPFSPDFRDLLADSGLKNARRGFGVRPTWPAQFRPFMIPLDHCLVSPPVGVRAFRTGPHIGSDHLPILVDLVIPPQDY